MLRQRRPPAATANRDKLSIDLVEEIERALQRLDRC